jgi:hypothetical protein
MGSGDKGGHGDEINAASGKQVEPEIAAPFGPFVSLLSQHGADRADDRVAVVEDPDPVAAASNLQSSPWTRSEVCLGLEA